MSVCREKIASSPEKTSKDGIVIMESCFVVSEYFVDAIGNDDTPRIDLFYVVIVSSYILYEKIRLQEDML